jgi:ribosomal protein L35
MFSRGFARVASETFSKVTARYPVNAVNKRDFGSALPLLFSRLGLSTFKCSKGDPLVSVRRSLFTIVTRPNVDRKLGHIGVILPCFGIVCRGTKTKKAAAKRFIKTGKGDLKYGHAGKRHNTSKKTKTVKRRLNRMVQSSILLKPSHYCFNFRHSKVPPDEFSPYQSFTQGILSGTWAKKMKELV